MTNENQDGVSFYYQGWDRYQKLLTEVVGPLTAEQLALRAAPNLRSIGELAAHIVRTRAGWYYRFMGEKEPSIAAIAAWNYDDLAGRTAAELVEGLDATWQVIAASLARWTRADLEYMFTGERNGEPYALSRQWVIWPLIEHDL